MRSHSPIYSHRYFNERRRHKVYCLPDVQSQTSPSEKDSLDYVYGSALYSQPVSYHLLPKGNDIKTDMLHMNENNKTPETVSKTTAVIVFLLVVFAGFTGYSFGADAGYAKGYQDCTAHIPLESLPLQSP